ncbi:MAG TPA: hypothetical protein VKR26_03400, partial [Terriglobales bacterium]|nr:hypothetical protein [Terriglobales bacterium]
MVIPRWSRSHFSLLRFVLVSTALIAASLPSAGQDSAPGSGPSNQVPPILKNVRYEQRLDNQVPLNLVFRDESGQAVRLSDYFGQR